MLGIYNHPVYYEIAFSFRDISLEVDVFEECFKRFSQIEVSSVLELACGPAPHLEELVKRGYQYHGLDLSDVMLRHVNQKARSLEKKTNLVHGNMVNFEMDKKVDFAFVLLGSLFVKDTSELADHFNSVARVLKKGGLYLLDWCIEFDQSKISAVGESWEIERNGIQVKTTVSWKAVNPVNQTVEETIALDVDDHGVRQTIVQKDVRRLVYPQEFLCFISNNEHFEFIGWWNNWDLSQSLEEADEINRQ
ncbi:MAG: class I SAM-dependent methyltransferase [Deltaproteobacteria bacterium]|nr:class I SAM-dependent methyltransferase [Deltaproteobacteria bacterium]